MFIVEMSLLGEDLGDAVTISIGFVGAGQFAGELASLFHLHPLSAAPRGAMTGPGLITTVVKRRYRLGS
jgi:hypothetical protein